MQGEENELQTGCAKFGQAVGAPVQNIGQGWVKIVFGQLAQ
jgi:hypothetical protein